MRYISTRGGAEPVDFVTACLAGLAPDGGLYVPESYPQIEPAKPTERYVDVAARILSAFAGDSLKHADILAMCERAYSSFSHQSVAPLVQTGSNTWMMELHHGPTLAFKDVAMQFIAQLFGHVLSERGEQMNIVCATSGDTGGAAAAAFANVPNVNLTILHPHERVSPVQRLFMTTTGAANVRNLALDGDFDDCQALVKQMFADRAFAERVNLSGVNSINWARIVAQSVYYAVAQAALGPDTPIRFVVPSGNMGDSLAGYVAAKCELLSHFEMVCAVNENDALAQIFETGIMKRSPAVATPSPAMDISVPSNFERLFFEASIRDGAAVKQAYDIYAQSGEVDLQNRTHSELLNMGISASTITNEETLEEIVKFEAETGWVICPHTAVASAQSRKLPASSAAIVILATAHAAKFPETISAKTGKTPRRPTRVEDLESKQEDYQIFPAEISRIQSEIGQSSAPTTDI